ncbi:DUF6922 domain-containing protein [Solitalea lacus]|uniref:DUF6922 domain-containing protein n=1 Tax=Solitalea lacus TaxID=2911172 RepID=UPI001EDB0A69|nr:hypothetical protein [Solitalea lacus]UKJ06748.1 hypothetical protein L2B55_14565 [Solitalea lacus]
MTPAISLKIDKALGYEGGTMLILQAFYEIKMEKQKELKSLQPDLKKFRKILFWDTEINKIDWQKQYKPIIQHIFERGNDVEKKEILRFYGKEKIREITGSDKVTGNRILLLNTGKNK